MACPYGGAGAGSRRWLGRSISPRRLGIGGEGQAHGLPLRGRGGWAAGAGSVDSFRRGARVLGGKGRHKACPYMGAGAGSGRWLGWAYWPRRSGIGGKGQAQGLPLRGRGGGRRALDRRVRLAAALGFWGVLGRHKACPYGGAGGWAAGAGSDGPIGRGARVLGGTGQAQGLPLRGAQGVGQRGLDRMGLLAAVPGYWVERAGTRPAPTGGAGAGSGRWLGRSIWRRRSGVRGKGQAQGLPLRGRGGGKQTMARSVHFAAALWYWGGKGRHKACPYGRRGGGQRGLDRMGLLAAALGYWGGKGQAQGLPLRAARG